jgi:hypothetical protein
MNFKPIRRIVRRAIASRRARVWNSTVILVHPKAEKVYHNDVWYWDDDAWHVREIAAERDLRAGRSTLHGSLDELLTALEATR